MSLCIPDLLAALADGGFHTGDELGRRLGVSKAAIWKAMHRLHEFGLDVHSVRGKGYRLSEPLHLLQADSILEQLPASCRQLLSDIEILHTIDSTNSHAMRRVPDFVAAAARGRSWICLAESQTAGKGRRGRHWVSPFGHNLYMSVLRAFGDGAAALDGLSLVVGLAVVAALGDLGFSGLQLKWPNDVLLDGRKLAGILLEMSGDPAGLCHVVIGIGLNLRSDPVRMAAVDQPWIALDAAGYRPAQRNAVAGAVLSRLLADVQLFERAGFAPFMERWQESDCSFGRELVLQTAAGSVTGRGLGVNPGGALLLELADGSVQRFHGGEVSLRLHGSGDREVADAVGN